jgi:polyhydroxyalkanoate synthesis regulator phasin
MVEAGKITREEMRERLSAMRRAIGEYNQGQNRKEISDDCIALRKKLGEAVRSGEMTREEAGKIWDEEGC